MRNNFNMFWVKIPRYMKDGNLRLRPLRVFDGPLLSRGLRDGTVFTAGTADKLLNSSWFSIWWMTKKAHTYSFCIELDSKPIGFTGLYDLTPGETTCISLVVFDWELRGKGYGTQVFKLLARNLQKYAVVKKIRAIVNTDNQPALSFWKKVGFTEIKKDNGIVHMSMNLNHSIQSG
jgi:ribosomal protein S18 acetylase RimI-like enzyme